MTRTMSKAAPAAASATKTGAWCVTVLLALFMLINYADKAVMGFAAQNILKDLGITAQQFGVIQSAFFWLFFAGAILLGVLSTKIGLRRLLAILMLVWVATMVPLVGTVGFTMLMLCRLILGFAEGPAYALANHAVHSRFPAEKRALPAGVVAAGASLGPVLMAPILTWVIVRWSWHAAFGVLVVAGAIWVVLWLAFGKDAPAASAASQAAESEVVDAPFTDLIRSGTLIGVALLMFFGYWSTTLKVAWLPLYLSDGLGYSTLATGRLVMIPYAVAAIGSISVGALSNRLLAKGVSRRVARGYLTGALVVASGVAMYGFTVLGQGMLQMVLITLAFSLNTASYAVAITAVADIVHPRKRGAVMGGLVAISSIAGVISPLVLGYFVENAANKIAGYGQGFALVGVLVAVGSVFATFMVHPDRDLAKFRVRVQGSVR
ncbi:MFS transporter [Streptomyces sp. NBC_00873]|uniref:MFS transporter n=1 Tax=unclassified Streptomyces TaxID=2593676 RepID=UPI003870056F|nr:MFS transporter [Streptomyces sp. NBC_00873]WTA46890.1 MFS transporter [Streptomyces sp. NBC_00842]